MLVSWMGEHLHNCCHWPQRLSGPILQDIQAVGVAIRPSSQHPTPISRPSQGPMTPIMGPWAAKGMKLEVDFRTHDTSEAKTAVAIQHVFKYKVVVHFLVTRVSIQSHSHRHGPALREPLHSKHGLEKAFEVKSWVKRWVKLLRVSNSSSVFLKLGN